MQMHIDELRKALINIMKQLFSGHQTDSSGSTLTFDTIRTGYYFKRFYRALEEINNISITCKDLNVKPLHDQAFCIYKAYIVGLELLGNTLKRLESNLTFSCVLIKRPCNNSGKFCPLVDENLRDKTKGVATVGTVKPIPEDSELILQYYYSFCKILNELSSNLQMRCPTEQEWDTNMENIERICDEMRLLMVNISIKTDETKFYEGKCTLLTVFVELRECIFQCFEMKSECIIDTLGLTTYEGIEKIPEYISGLENTYQGKVNAKDFLRALRAIKKNSTKTVPCHMKAFDIE